MKDVTPFRYYPSTTPAPLRAALKIIGEDFPIVPARRGGRSIDVKFSALGGGRPAFVYEDGVARVSGATVPQVLRALATLRGFVAGGRIPRTYEGELAKFDTLGMSLDVSRGAVWNVPAVKMLLRRAALMGLNTFMLYTEDTYEVPGMPYFGYLRGRYSQAELKELDDYANALGIEMIPCIQTLAHLFQMLRWEVYGDIADTYYILLAGEKRTYELVEKMIAAASAPYRSRRIHIGMDEAVELGLHRYRELHGIRPRVETMNLHVRRVVAICRRLGLRPMMWSDMYRPHKQAGPKDVYTSRPKGFERNIPKGVELVYWDYYHNEVEDYRQVIDYHRSLGKEPIFAPGLWTWHKFWQDFRKVRASCGAGMTACKEKGVRQAIITCWGDDGNEADMLSLLPGLQFYAEHAYANRVTDAAVARQFFGACGSDISAWTFGGEIDHPPGVRDRSGLHPANPSKFLLWQDPLVGIFDMHLKGMKLGRYYGNLANAIRKAATAEMPTIRNHLHLPLRLCEVLADKAELGLRLLDAYRRGDRKAMARELNVVILRLTKAVERLHEAHRRIWFELYKPNGWEIIDNRYAALAGRLRSTAVRLGDYLAGRVASLPELEEKRLPARDWPKGTLSDAHMSYRYLVSPSVIP
ncbi:MAG: beta-N-acetylhexosaminidase [Phycisphaerae bacterium]